MDSVEYRSVIKFLVLRGLENSEIHRQLTEVYGTLCPSKPTIYFWIGEFKRGRTSVFDLEKSGRPVEIDCGKLQKRCEEVIKEQRRITLKELAREVNVSEGKVHEILQSLGIRKLSSRFVPRFLSAEMCEMRLECCQRNLQVWEEHGERFLNSIITVDETPLSLYLPESKRESLEWRLPDERAPRKMRSGTSHRRCLMLTVLWDSRGILKVDYAEKGVTINSAYYASLIYEARSRRRKPRGSPLWLLQDNAPVHTSAFSKDAIFDAGFHILPHPPYSPDLAPSDFWLFRHLKKSIRGKVFHSPEEVKQDVTNFLDECSPDFFKNAFLELVERWQKCVLNQGSYIEK